MARRRRKPPPEDDTIRSLLARLARCDVAAVGVLADYLDENAHPLAARVRRLWTNYQRDYAYWVRNSPGVASRWTAWECRAGQGRRLRRKLGALFGRRWKNNVALRKFPH